MSIVIRVIPFIELLLVLAMLGLGSLGYLSLMDKADQQGQNQYQSAGKWVLPGLIGLAILAVILFLMVSFFQG